MWCYITAVEEKRTAASFFVYGWDWFLVYEQCGWFTRFGVCHAGSVASLIFNFVFVLTILNNGDDLCLGVNFHIHICHGYQFSFELGVVGNFNANLIIDIMLYKMANCNYLSSIIS